MDKLAIFGTRDEQTRLKLEALDEKQKQLERQYQEALEKEIPKLVEGKVRNIVLEFEVMNPTLGFYVCHQSSLALHQVIANAFFLN